MAHPLTADQLTQVIAETLSHDNAIRKPGKMSLSQQHVFLREKGDAVCTRI